MLCLRHYCERQKRLGNAAAVQLEEQHLLPACGLILGHMMQQLAQ
jgi:hypothetical protein